MNILNKLTIKHLKMNKKRTIVTIIGVILSCALMVGIGLLFSTFRDYMIKETISYSGPQHVIYTKMDPSKQEILKSNKNIETYYTSQLLGYSDHETLNQEMHQYLLVITGSKNFLDTVEIYQGRMPNNENEIVLPRHIVYKKDQEIKIGDTITLNIGYRSFEGKKLPDEEPYIEGETLENTKSKKYKVVGIIDRSIYEAYHIPAYYAITTSKNLDNNIETNFYVTFKKEKNITKQGNALAKQLGIQSETEEENEYYNLDKVEYNYNLLSFYGESKYDNFNIGMSMVISMILLLISVGCTIVIYNSFAISVIERKKQFGLFSSIGTTKKQLRHTVFFEALIIGSIGIPIGILSGFIGIGIVLEIMKYLVPEVFEPLKLTPYPLFIIIPIIFMIIVILLSALIPAKLASRVSPIEAIRQNDDIKIKNRKIKSNRLIKKVFGIEGDLAYKNIKRNKKKYRITIISLFISIVLFISFSSFLQYGIMSSNDYLDTPESDILITIEEDNKNKVDQVVNQINNLDHIDESTYFQIKYNLIKNIEYKNLSIQAQKNIIKENWEKYNYAILVKLSEQDEQQFKKEANIKNIETVLINNISGISYEKNKRISYNVPYFKTIPDKIELCNIEYSEEKMNENGAYEEPIVVKEECNQVLTNIQETKTIPYGIKDLSSQEIILIVSQEQFDKAEKEQRHYLLINSKKASKIDEDIQKILKDSGLQYFYENVAKEMQMVKNLTLVIQILLYGFISLVTLIGVTSVFNTINTSIALRRREFAMLRSVGLTPQGLNKMIIFESIFFGIKSLLYGLPIGCAISYWFYLSFSNFSNYEQFTLPYKSILITIIGVFIIVYVTMTYATKKIKKENILTSIKEENI